jgi:putative DNA primase/helicase
MSAEASAQLSEVGPLGMAAFMSIRFPPRKYLLNPWLTTTGLAMLYAPAGHGKTMFAMSVGYSVAAGVPMLTWTCDRPARVLYVDGELPGTLCQTRLRQLGPALPETNFRVLARSQFELAKSEMLDLGTLAGRDFLDRVIEQHGFELIILDSVSTLVRSGSDNDADSWRVIQEWSLGHRLRGRSVLFLHHDSRTGKPRGTSMREVVLDTMIHMVRQVPRSADAIAENESVFALTFTKSREFFGESAAPMILRMSTESGTVQWRSEDGMNDKAVELASKGVKQVDIATQLNISQGRVSQILKQRKRDQPGKAPG